MLAGPTQEQVLLLSGAANTHSILFEAASSEYADITDAAQTGLDLTGDFTIMGWVRFATVPGIGDQQMYTSKWSSGVNRAWIGPNFRATAGPLYQIEMGIITATGNLKLENVSWSPVVNTWRHVAVTNDASYSASSVGRFTFIIDGVDQGVPTQVSTGTGANQYNTNAPFHVNSFPTLSAASFVDGYFDEVAIFDAVLSAAQVNSLKDAAIPDATANFIGAWSWDGLSLTSHGPNANLLTNHGGSFETEVPFA